MSVSHAHKYAMTRAPVLGHISPVTGARTFIPMCFHLIVYIPLRRLSPHSICIVARILCKQSRICYAWPVFTEPTGPIRHVRSQRVCAFEEWCSRLSIASVFIMSLCLSSSPSVYSLTCIGSPICALLQNTRFHSTPFAARRFVTTALSCASKEPRVCTDWDFHVDSYEECRLLGCGVV